MSKTTLLVKSTKHKRLKQQTSLRIDKGSKELSANYHHYVYLKRLELDKLKKNDARYIEELQLEPKFHAGSYLDFLLNLQRNAGAKCYQLQTEVHSRKLEKGELFQLQFKHIKTKGVATNIYLIIWPQKSNVENCKHDKFQNVRRRKNLLLGS